MLDEKDKQLEEPNKPELENDEPAADESADDEVKEPTDTSADGDDTAAQQPQRKKRTARDRIDELTANWRNTERDRDEWRRLAQQVMEDKGKIETPKPSETPKPAEDQFSDYSAYVEALADWKADQKIQTHLSEVETRRQVEAQQRTQDEAVRGFRQRAAEFAKEHPDYHAVAESPNVPINQAMFDAILESDRGPQIAYHLGQHPEEAARISSLSAPGAARELGKLEAQLSIPSKPKTSQAPDPVVPVGGGSERNTKDPDKMTTAEWMAWRNQQVSGK
jgi:hypothetical protein